MTPDRFAALEEELGRGEPWRYREDDSPNPLIIEVTGWSSGHTRRGDAEFLNGVDREGKAWSVIVGPTVLRRRLIDGEVSEWDEERGCYVVTGSEGRVQPGELVAIRYRGERDGTSGQTYADFYVVRKQPEPGAAPSVGQQEKPPASTADSGTTFDDADIPF